MKIIYTLITVIIIYSCATNKNSKANDKIVYLNDETHFYLDDDIDYWQQFSAKDYTFSNKNSDKTLSNDFLFNLKQNNSEMNISVFKVSDSLTYFDKINSDTNILNLNIEESLVLDYFSQTFKSTLISYKKNEKEVVEKIIFAPNNLLRFVISENAIDKLLGERKLNELIKNAVINANLFVGGNTEEVMAFFRTDYFNYNSFITTKYFSKNRDIHSLLRNPGELNYLITSYNESGDYKNVKMLLNTNFTNDAVVWSDSLKVANFSTSSIKNYVDSLEDIDILLVNDHHFFESSRYTFALFLKELKKKGFTHLGGESFTSYSDYKLNYDIEPEKLYGQYIKQPTYGLMAQYAILNNFNLFG